MASYSIGNYELAKRVSRVTGVVIRSSQRGTMAQVMNVPYTLEQDEDGVWCAHAQLRPSVGANADGPTREAAITELGDALTTLVAEFSND